MRAREAPFFTDELVERTSAAMSGGAHHPLIVTAAFVLDLLCIHPFADGNGRVARLLTSHLLGESGYGAGRFVSIERLIYDTKDDYYASLGASTAGCFDDGHHDVCPWVRCLLTRLDECYTRFDARVALRSSVAPAGTSA